MQFPGAVYHVTARGNERKAIFWDDDDRERFLETLGEGVERFGTKIHAYCLMPNHYHLLFGTPEGNLSISAGWLQTTYSIRFNRRHGRSGHLFQGRFKAHLVEGDVYGRELVKYIHLNPVRPKNKKKPIPIERKSEMNKYAWSSHLAYLGIEEGPEWLSLDWLEGWGRNRTEAGKRYKEEVEAAFGSPLESPWEKAKGGLVVGGKSLWKKAKKIIEASSGSDEIRWVEKENRGGRTQRARAMADEQLDFRIKMWIRTRLGGERYVDLARETGYSDGSGILHVTQRLEIRAKSDKSLEKSLGDLRRKFEMSSVKS